MKRLLLLSIFFACLAFSVLAYTDLPPTPSILIQPLGHRFPEESLSLVRKALVEFYGLPIRVLQELTLPAEAYYEPRRRFRAEKLLGYLEALNFPDGSRVLGLTGVDISTTNGTIPDWGVIGLAELDGGGCIVSSYRCALRGADESQARIRLAKVAVHEIGHTLGLPHCSTPGCLMEDAHGRIDTVDREYDLCAGCRARVDTLGHALPEHPEIPWPKPGQ